MHVTGKFVVNLRKIRIQCYWVWGGEGEASCVEPVTAKGVRYRIGAESGEGVRICAGPPWTRPRCLAVRIHRSQVILWAGIGTCIFRNRSTTAESDDIPIRLKYLDTNGNVVTLCSGASISKNACPNASPKDDLAAMDPNCQAAGACPWGAGANPNSLTTFSAYPVPNTFGGDGLNTGGFTFSAPNPITLNTYLAKVDYELSSHMHLFLRGIQQGDRISGAPQFPGDPPSSEITDTSKGIAAGYLWTIGNNRFNNFRYGYIRQGLNVTGAGTASFSDFAGLSPLTGESRSTLLNVPVHNFAEDFTWIKGKHTLQFGVNWRLIHNNTSSNAISFDSATSGAGNISQAAIAGTGQSFDPAAFGYPTVSGSFGTSYDNAVTDIAGLLSTINANNNYQV